MIILYKNNNKLTYKIYILEKNKSDNKHEKQGEVNKDKTQSILHNEMYLNPSIKQVEYARNILSQFFVKTHGMTKEEVIRFYEEIDKELRSIISSLGITPLLIKVPYKSRKITKEQLRVINSVIAKSIQVTPEEIKSEDKFIDTYGIDSLDFVGIVIELEKEFDISIPDDKIDGCESVGEFVSIIELIL